MPQFIFNAMEHEPRFGGTPQFPPAKKMKVVIFEVELRENAKKDGGFMHLKMRCVEGPNQGREGFTNLNLSNPNPQTVDIAKKQLSAICYVTNVFNMQQTEQLHNIPFLIDVDWQKGNEPSQAKPEGGYTEVTAVYDANGNKPGQAGKAPTAAAPVVPPAAPPAQPWAQPPAPQAPAAPVTAAPAAPVTAAPNAAMPWAQQPQPAAPAAPANPWGAR